MTTPSSEFQKGLSLHQRGQLDDAEAIYRSILVSQPKYFDAVYALGLVHLQRQDFETAERQFALALKLNPKSSPLQNNRGNAFAGMGQLKEAIASYERAISLDPKNAEAFYNLGNAFVAAKQFDAAISSYDKSLALFPNNPNIHNNRGSALAALNRLNEAVASFDRALKLDSAFANAMGNRGTALASLGKNEEAVESLQRAVTLMPSDANLFYSLGQLFVDLKQHDRAASAFQKALALRPDLDYARSDYLFSKLQLCNWAEFKNDCETVFEGVRTETTSALPFSILALPSNSDDQRKCAEQYVRNKVTANPKPLWKGEKYTHDRIRIAYISADLGEHIVARVAASVFETHDHERFELTALNLGSSDSGPTRKRLIAAFDRFLDVQTRSDAEIAKTIREAEIDIVIDPSGYTRGFRPGIFAQRAAPVQVNWLGFAATMGAQFYDYILADEIVIPPEKKNSFVEQVVYLPDSFFPADNKLPRPAAPSRAEVGLPQNGFVFAAFHQNFKILPNIFDSWMRILKAVKGSVLWLSASGDEAQANLRREAEARGISAARIVFAKRVESEEDHIARLQLADLFLDTQPYNAHATAYDFLWAGVPVLTVQGDTFVSRVASSLLKAAELSEMIVATPEEYELRAIELAGQPERVTAIRQKLIHHRDTAPLFDTARYTRHLEAAYTHMWERSQKGKSPQSFAIEPITT